MGGAELRDLAGLDPSRFDAREHAALSWVRAVLTMRDGAPADVVAGFEQAFDERERGYIIASMKSMYFFNLAGNTLDAWIRRLMGRSAAPHPACTLHDH